MAKFRSWNEEENQFYYWQDGEYNFCGGYTEMNHRNRFNWQNAEQCLYENKVLPEIIYKNDIGIIQLDDGYTIKGVVDIDIMKGLYIMKDNVKYYVRDYPESFFITEGNIHEKKVL